MSWRPVGPLARFFPRLVKMVPAGERPEDLFRLSGEEADAEPAG